MAITQNTYTGNGSTVLYSFSFPYLETTDVKVSLNGTVTTAYTFANATTIQFNTAPANGAAIRIYRETDDTALQAVLSPGSSIRASDLNDNFDQLIYLGQEANTEADSATATANTALTNSATAISTANTASTNASAAVSTANTASANASAAVSTANTASTNASTAVSTANTASTNASTALSTANAATTTANNAVTTANTASSTASTALTNANAAVSTANTASTNASNAVTTANTASANASSAVTTANNAVTTANSAVITAGSAVTTANSAVTTANAAAAAVANAVLYTTVANVAAIPVSPANNTAIEVTNSTGIESFTPLSGLPAGFVGSSGLSVRIIYQTVGSTWTWIQYFPNDPENRYFKLSGGTITGPITVPQGTVSSPGVKFSGTGNDNTGVYSPGIDELGLVTNGTARLTIDSAGSVSIPGTLGVTGAITGSLTGAASSNVLKAGDTMTGNLTAPAFIPNGSTVPTNGLYLPSANNVAISTNGTGRMFVDSTGRVGINTSSPTQALHVYAGAFQAQAATDNTNTDISLIRAVAGPTGGAVFNIRAADGANDNSDWLITTNANENLRFNVGGSERMRITSDGKLGLGTSTPVDTLHVVGAARFGDGTNFAGVSASSSGTSFEAAAGSANVLFKTGGTTRVLIDSSGRVGIGTTNPTDQLHVVGNILAIASSGNRYVEAKSGTSGVQLACDGNTNFVYGYGAIPLTFSTNGGEKARIDSSGRLLVGLSSAPSGGISQYAKLSVVGNTLSAANGAYFTIGRGSAGTGFGAGVDIGQIIWTDNAGAQFASIGVEADAACGTNDFPGRLVFSTTADGASSPTERMRIGSNGAVTFSGGTGTLAINAGAADNNAYIDAGKPIVVRSSTGGVLLANNATSWTAFTSESRLKDFIADPDVDQCWNLVRDIELKRYYYKDQDDKSGVSYMGPMADWLGLQDPELLIDTGRSDDDGPIHTYNQGLLDMKALAALSAALKRIEDLEARLSVLESA